MAFCGCDKPSYYVARWRKARKVHECLECCEIIHPGERYRRVDGHWLTVADSFATCEACAWLWDILFLDRRKPVIHGELAESLERHHGRGGRSGH